MPASTSRGSRAVSPGRTRQPGECAPHISSCSREAPGARATHAARAAGCWTAKDEKPAIEQTTGRQRLNIHGAIDLETGRTRMIEAEVVDAASTIKLLASLEALYSTAALIHVFRDNAR